MLRLSRLLYIAPASSSLFLSTRGSSSSNHKGRRGGGGGGGGGGEKKGTPIVDTRTGGKHPPKWNFDIDSFTHDSVDELLLPIKSKPRLSPSRQQNSKAATIEKTTKKTTQPKKVVEEEIDVYDDDDNDGSDMDKEETVTGAMNNYSPHISQNSAADVESKDRGRKAPKSLSNPFRGLHEHIHRSYRLDQLIDVASPSDLLLGRQESKSGAFSFIRFESSKQFLEDAGSRPVGGVDSGNDYALTIAQRLLDFPPHMRHFHSICSRENVPCDFFADVDLPNETPESGERILLEMLNYLDIRLQGIGFIQPSFMILTNEVPSTEKVSYHVHARAMGFSPDLIAELDEGEVGEEDGDAEDLATSKKKKKQKRSASEEKKNTNRKQKKPAKSAASKIIAFQDYRAVRLLADEVNQTLGRTVVDEQTYRANGMLRCAYSSKIVTVPIGGSVPTPPAVSQRGKRLIPLRTARDAALRRRLKEMTEQLGSLNEAGILERSFGTRFAPVPARQGKKPNVSDSKEYLRQFKLIRPRHILGPKSAQAMEFDAYGNAVSPYLTEGAKWRRFKTVVEKLRRMPLRSSESYDLWVRVGLALHNFSNEDHVFDEWVRFSLRCPQKYSREACRKKWQQFERNPDALNWRRGFNYLNSSIWRSVYGG